MFIKTFEVGGWLTNCYIIADEISKKSLILDPGDEPDRIIEVINENGFIVDYIICTHGHFDHIGAVLDLKKLTGAKIVLHKDDLLIYERAKDKGASWGVEMEAQPVPDIFVNDGDIINIGNLSFEVLHTPGHSPGSISLYIDGFLFTGDTLFEGSIGRTDFPGGDINKLKESLQRLIQFKEDTKVLSGHNRATTIGKEKKQNLFLL